MPKRGAIPSPRSALASAVPYAAPIGAPATFFVKPNHLSMWGNDVHGDCVTAEEAFAKACNSPEIFISDSEVIAWATRHGVLEGAYLTQVMTWMQNDGFDGSAVIYDDGPYFSVDWTNAGVLQSAISQGPVKLGVAANQLDNAWNSTGGASGWFATGFHSDPNEDHCVSLCGYGSMSWLAQQLGVPVPGAVNGTHAGYAMFTWDSIGIIDVPSMIAITSEAWVRRPTTVARQEGKGPTVAVAGNGDQFVFWKGTDNNLWQAVKRGAGAWQGPHGLGMGPLGSDPDAGVDGKGATYVYWKGNDNNLWRGYWDGTKWVGPEEVAGMGPLGSAPTVTVAGNGDQFVFWKGTDNNLWQAVKRGAGAWQGPTKHGMGPLGSGPDSAVDGAEATYVYWKGNDNNLWRGYWDGTKWVGPEEVPGMGPLGSPPTVAVAGNGDQFVFWKGTDNNLWQAVKRGAGAWQGPTKRGMGPLGSSPDTGVDGAGATYVYWKGTDHNLWRGYWDGSKWAGAEEVPGMGPLG